MINETEQKEKKKFKNYGKSKKGNFYVKDSIGVPHPYCITPKHLTGESMFLGKAEIKHAEEEHGAVCDICRVNVKAGKQDKILSIDEHEQALLIGCKMEIKDNKELQEYLLSIKDKATKKGFVGFAFLQEF